MGASAFTSSIRRFVDQRATLANVGLYAFTWHHANACSVELCVYEGSAGAWSALAEEWQLLEAEAEETPFFLSWHWIGTWLREVVGERHLLLARVRSQEGPIVGLAVVALVEEHWGPLRSRVAYLNELPMPRLDMTIEQNGCLARSGWEVRAFDALVDALSRTALKIEEVRCRGIDARFMAGRSIAGGRHPRHIDQVRPAWVVNAEQGRDIEQLLARLSRNKRWQVRRFMRLAEEQHGPLTLHEAADEATAEHYFRRLADLHNAYWRSRGRTGVFSNERWWTFHHALVMALLPRRQIQLLRVSAGELEVGYLYNIRHGREVINIQSGFSYQADNRWRPGYASHLLAAAAGAAQGYPQYNLLVGDDRYKSSLADEGPCAYWFSVYPKRLANKRYLLFRLLGLLRRVRARIMGNDVSVAQAASLDRLPKPGAAVVQGGVLPSGSPAIAGRSVDTDVGTKLVAERCNRDIDPAATSSRDVVVLDGDLAQTLAIVRSLGKAGARVHVVAPNRKALALRSRYCSRALVLPNPVSGGKAFVQQLAMLLQELPGALVFPVSDRTLLPLVEFESLLPEEVTVVRASNDSLVLALSKAETMRIADETGVPRPGSCTVTCAEEIDRALATIPFPQVVKADRSFAADDSGRLHNREVCYADTPAEARRHIEAMLVDGAVLVQQRVKGDGVGYGALMDNGRLLTEFQWRRLHEVPITGGGSSYRISEAVDPRLRNYSAALLGAMKWTGVAMVEFKHDRDSDQHWLMEVNGRFWGSLPLAVVSGADFPAQLYQLYCGQTPEQPAYREGIRCRLLRKDIEWVLQAIDARSARAPHAPSLGVIVRDCVRILHPRDRLDMQAWNDPLPGLCEIWEVLRQKVSNALSRLRRRVS